MSVRFASEVQRQAYEQAKVCLRESFGHVRPDREEPVLHLAFGSSRVEVSVQTHRERQVLIRSRAVVVRGAKISSSLFTFLLEQNATLDQGAFALGDQDEVLFQHAFVATQVDPVTLQASVYTVLHVADAYDDRIKARWGGLTALEWRPARPPPQQPKVIDSRVHEATATGVTPVVDDQE